MALDVGEVDLRVQTFDDRSVLSPEVLEVVVREVVARIDARHAARQRHGDDVRVWGSVREGGGW